MTDGLELVPRDKIKHGQLKRIMRLYNDMNSPGAREHFDALQSDFEAELDKLVIAVPSDWLPKGVKLHDVGWMEELEQGHFEEISQTILLGQPVGKKTD